MPTPFFADMVRELCHEGGTGPLTPTGAAPGHRRFADAVPEGAPFHYAVAGVTHPAEWESGTGRIDAAGRLVRDTVAASSNGGARVDFAPGLKTIALTVGAGWFAGQDAVAAAQGAAIADQADALAGKQPLSTSHAAAAHGADGDAVTVRRGAGWVNIPLAALAYRDGTGRLIAGAPLACVDGTAAAPSMAFGGDPGTGLFRPGAGMFGFAVGGVERARFGWNGNLGIGTGGTPGARLHARSADAELLRIETTAARGGGNLFMSFYDPVGRKGFLGYGASIDDRFVILNEMSDPLMFGTAGDVRWQITASGHFAPMADSGYDMGSGGSRVRNLYLANNPIVTSDRRLKSYRADPAPRAAELAAALEYFDVFGFFQFDASIGREGPDGARWHYGPRAQALWDICAAHGLVEPLGEDGRPVAGSIPPAFLCFDRWDEEVETRPAGTGTESVVVREAGDIFGVRVDQLHSLMLAALNGERKAQEARIAALAARLDALEAAA